MFYLLLFNVLQYHLSDNWNAADTEARRHLSEDAIYIHPFDGQDIWNGHATIIDELKGWSTMKQANYCYYR